MDRVFRSGLRPLDQREFLGNVLTLEFALRHFPRPGVADPQALVMDLVTTAPKPGGGQMQTIGLPWEFSETQPGLGAAPRLGEHTNAVLAELGSS